MARRKKKAGFFTKVKRLIILSVVLVVAIAAFLFFSLNGLIKKGIETVGPKATQCTVEVDSVSLFPLIGSGSISKLTVGNPVGYYTPNAIHINKASISLDAGSLMEEKVIIHSIEFIAPEFTYEGNKKKNNLTTIINNIDTYVEKLGLANEDEEPTKLQIDDLHITNAIVKLEIPIFRGKTVDLKLKDIHLEDLGYGPEGITGGEVASRALGAILKQTTIAIPKKIAELGTGGVKSLGGLLNIFRKD